LFAKTGKLQSISEQNLIDCTVTCETNYLIFLKQNSNRSVPCAAGGGGCSGGWITDGYDYVKNNSGIDTTAAYPYVGVTGSSCAYKATGSAGTVSGFAYTKTGDEVALMNAVATRGPVS